MRNIMQVVNLIHILDSDDGDWTREQKIEEIKRVRDNRDITNDEALDLAILYSEKWQAADHLRRQEEREERRRKGEIL